MASPTDLIAAEPESVSVRFDITRSVVCDSIAPDEVAVFRYDSVTNANLPASFRGSAYSGPYEATYAYGDGWTPAVVSTGSGPKSDCTARGAPTTAPPESFRRLSGWNAEFGEIPDRGSILRAYGRLTYRFAPSVIGGGLAVWRNGQELVSPFDTGATFRYEMADGSVRTSVTASDLPEVRRIRIDVTAIGDGVNRYAVQRRIDYAVPLRN